ncbi:hypothetical protein EGW08_004727 [Elysia chlorotica]|uniref:Uncharacterized protein n=1 Tax=Elysia chlorotica TaxID=188477 RepID=A0A433U137_ELYCH|nr:hypothetical protein EGW08_004727 [Elysia chlorotica]
MCLFLCLYCQPHHLKVLKNKGEAKALGLIKEDGFLVNQEILMQGRLLMRGLSPGSGLCLSLDRALDDRKYTRSLVVFFSDLTQWETGVLRNTREAKALGLMGEDGYLANPDVLRNKREAKALGLTDMDGFLVNLAILLQGHLLMRDLCGGRSLLVDRTRIDFLTKCSWMCFHRPPADAGLVLRNTREAKALGLMGEDGYLANPEVLHQDLRHSRLGRRRSQATFIDA